MTVQTLNPAATVSEANTAIFGGAASRHVALNDGLDATYIGVTGSASAWVVVDVDDFTLPAGAVTVGLQVTARATNNGSGTGILTIQALDTINGSKEVAKLYAAGLDGTVRARQGTEAAVNLTQAQTNGLRLKVWLNKSQYGYARAMAASALLRYATQPTCAVSAPTGSLTSSTVTAIWSHTPGSDGGSQIAYDAKLFTAAQYGAGGFDASTSQPTLGTGIVAGSATQVDFIGVPDGTNHRIYVRTAQSINGAYHWSAWTSTTFSVTLTRAEVLNLAATGDSANGLVSVVVNRDTAKDAWTGVDLERLAGVDMLAGLGQFEGTPSGGFAPGITSGQIGSPTGVTVTTGTSGVRGQVQKITATNAAGTAVYVTPTGSYPAAVDATVDVVAYAGTVGSWGGNAMLLGVTWVDALGAILSTSTATLPGIAGWAGYTARFTAPASAVAFRPLCGIIGNAAGTLTADFNGLMAFVGSAGWTDVPGALTTTPAANTVTLLDYPLPGRTAVYRARAVKAGGVTGSYVYAPDLASWTATSIFLRDVSGSTPGPMLTLDGWQEDGVPTERWDASEAVHRPIGRTMPVVVRTGQQVMPGTCRWECLTLAEADTFIAILDGRRIMIAQPSSIGASMFAVALDVERVRQPEQLVGERRYLQLNYQPVD